MQLPYFGEVTKEKLLSDPTIWVLIVANISAIFFAWFYQWDFLELILVYWCQSIIIGFFYFIKLLFNKIEPEPMTITVNNSVTKVTGGIKGAITFAVSYGFLHVFYLVFIVLWFGMLSLMGGDFSLSSFFSSKMEYAILFFFIAHAFSYVYYSIKSKNNALTKKNEEKSPYDRIIGIHLCVWFAGVLVHPFGIVMILFLAVMLFSGAVANKKLPSYWKVLGPVITLILAAICLVFFRSILLLIVVSVIKTSVDVLSHYKKHANDSQANSTIQIKTN